MVADKQTNSCRALVEVARAPRNSKAINMGRCCSFCNGNKLASLKESEKWSNGSQEKSDEVARSCNRPRFKLKPARREASKLKTTPDELKRTTSIPSICLMISLIILKLISTTLISCDDPTTTTATSQEAQQARLAQLRVASFASKLEQYLQCNRINLLQAINQQQQQQQHQRPAAANLSAAAGGQLAECRAHFDGHLCWPQAKAGDTIRLGCPKLSWLPATRRNKAENNQNYSSNSDNKNNGYNNRDQSQSNGDTGSDNLNSPTSPSVIINSIKQQQAAAAVVQPASNNSLTSVRVNQPSTMVEAAEGPTTTTTTTTTAADQSASPTAAAAAAKQTAGQLQAQRKCQPAEEAPELARDTNKLAPAAWQSLADYSQCAQTGANLFDPTDEYVKLSEPDDVKLFDRLAQELDRIEANIDPYGDVDLLEQWSFCIGEIIRESNNIGQQSGNNDNQTGAHCPIIFDGWRCWPSTKAGEVALVSCPSNQPGFSAESKAHKICTQEGDWYRHPMTNRYWSNYTTCVDTVDLAFRTKILNLYVIGNVISLIALAASLIIFISFKSLNCTRVTIHKNLFLSFITNNLMWIIWYTYVVNDADLLQSNPIECQFWHILLHYFLVSNYFWMFCEGLYLHTLLVVAFVSEDKILKWFYLLGWLTPVPITIAYAYNRSYDDYYTNFCWMEESPHNIILMAPIGISLLLNLVFLINIVRVLVTKLRANNSPDTHQTRKAVRATLILIPLLGLHYMLTPFRPEAKSEWEVYYEIIAAVCTSFQGLCVALLFCFCNGEVITVIKKKLKDTFRAREPPMRSRSNTAVTGVHNFNGSNNNHYHQNRQHQLEASHTLRSVVSSSSNGDLIQHNGNQLNSLNGNHINHFGRPPNANNNNHNHNSQTSSLLTTVESTPVHQTSPPATTTPTPTTGANNVVKTSQLDYKTTSLALSDEEAVKLL